MRAIAMICATALQLGAENSPAETDWNKIRNSKQESELQEFIAKYPQSKFADIASRRLDELAASPEIPAAVTRPANSARSISPLYDSLYAAFKQYSQTYENKDAGDVS